MEATKRSLAEMTVHPLAHLVPSASYKSKFIPRVFDGVDDTVLFNEARAAGESILIEGPTGPGKTFMVYAWAAGANLPLVNIPCNGAADPRMFVGGWTPTPDGTYKFVPGELVLAALYGGVVYGDELNMLPERIAVFLHGLMDDRKTISIPEAVGSDFPTSVVAHKDFIFVGSMNPTEGYRGTRELNAAWADRFDHKILFGYDPVIERKLIESDALVELAEGIRERAAVGDITTPLSTRALVRFEGHVRNENLGWDYAVGNLSRKFKGVERAAVAEAFALHSVAIRRELRVPEDAAVEFILDSEKEVF